MNCPQCNADLNIKPDQEYIICGFCDSEFEVLKERPAPPQYFLKSVRHARQYNGWVALSATLIALILILCINAKLREKHDKLERDHITNYAVGWFQLQKTLKSTTFSKMHSYEIMNISTRNDDGEQLAFVRSDVFNKAGIRICEVNFILHKSDGPAWFLKYAPDINVNNHVHTASMSR